MLIGRTLRSIGQLMGNPKTTNKISWDTATSGQILQNVLLWKRAHEIAYRMPDEFPFGYALYLAEAEARGEKMPWDR